jgi:Down syndrome cell adhesion protein
LVSTDNGQRSDFKPISSNFHIQTLENGSLTIKEVTEKDRASYLCEAGNGVGAELSMVVKLSVHVRAHFKSNFQVIRVSRGKPLTVSCEAFGEKPLHIKWTKDSGAEIDINAHDSK